MSGKANSKVFREIDPQKIETKDLHQFMVGSVGPRPIAFVSTIDEEGKTNVAPYSFFNAFSSNPPIVVFSSNRRVSNNTTKDTLANIKATRECVVNMVSYPIVRQMTIASVEWPTEISEFEAAGLTPIASDHVKPPRVKESPVHMECKVKEIVTLGDQGGAGHLIICDVLKMHIEERVIDERNRIDPHKLDLMGRLGRSFYVRASGDAVFPIVQSVVGPAIGWFGLPDHIKNSEVLSGNDLGILAGAPAIPQKNDLQDVLNEDQSLSTFDPTNQQSLRDLHEYVKALIAEGKTEYAIKVVFASTHLI